MRTVIGFTLWAVLCVSTQAASPDKLRIYTVNYPLQYFAQRIAGAHAEVIFPVPAGLDPAFWQPAAESIGDFQRADLIVLNGADYAKWVGLAALPRRKLIDSSARFRERYIQIANSTTHSHGPDGEHGHVGVAFTTWLDMQQAIVQSQAIARALTRKRPQHAGDFARKLAALAADLQRLDDQFRATAATIGAQAMLASHPVYQYFSRRYELNVRSVLWEPDEVPNAVQRSELESLLAQHPARWMIWEASPAAATLAYLKTLNVKAIVINPAGNRPTGGDFLGVMQQNLANLTRVAVAD